MGPPSYTVEIQKLLPPREAPFTRLFVYGSLRTKGSHGFLMKDASRLGPFQTLPMCQLLADEWYPGLIPGSGIVMGDLFRVPTHLWTALDAFEECPTVYQCAPVQLEDRTWAWTYWIRPRWAQQMQGIPCGDWLARMQDPRTR